MRQRQAWTDHEFNLGIDLGWTANVLNRLEDTNVRLRHLATGIPKEQLSAKRGSQWSIKEHIGHLLDLEQLWIDRFSQFEKGVPELVHADMANKKTDKAGHNDSNIEELLNTFDKKRHALIQDYRSLSEKAQEHVALHPRLDVSMRPIDLLFFIAEHDDHHITTIKALIKTIDYEQKEN